MFETAFRKIGLIEDFATTLKISRQDFLRALEPHVERSDLDFFSGMFEAFSSSAQEYKGRLHFDGFAIRKKRKMFDRSAGFAAAKGTYYEKGEQLTIEATINGFNSRMIPFFIFVLIFYAIFITVFLSSSPGMGTSSWAILPFIFLHATLMLGIPIFIMRKGVKRLKHDTERDLYYFTRTDIFLS